MRHILLFSLICGNYYKVVPISKCRSLINGVWWISSQFKLINHHMSGINKTALFTTLIAACLVWWNRFEVFCLVCCDMIWELCAKMILLGRAYQNILCWNLIYWIRIFSSPLFFNTVVYQTSLRKKIIKTEVLCDSLLDTDFGSIAINHTPYVFMGEHNISHPALNAPC